MVNELVYKGLSLKQGDKLKFTTDYVGVPEGSTFEISFVRDYHPIRKEFEINAKLKFEQREENLVINNYTLFSMFEDGDLVKSFEY